MHRGTGRAALTALALVLAVLVPVASASGTPTARTKPVAASSPGNPSSGRYHALAAPAVAISTLTGAGTTKAPLAAGSDRTVRLGGRAGLPTAGLRAVAAVVEIRSTEATDLYAGPGNTRPDVPTVTTSSGTASAFSVLPTDRSGNVHLWAGAASVAVVIHVVGWFADGAETGTAGLLNRLSGRAVSSATLAQGATKAVAVAGTGDVPTQGVDSVLVRLSSTGASSAGVAGVAPSAAAAKATTSLAYAPGAASDLAIVKLAGGRLVLANTGAAAAKLQVQVIGWFTDGTDPAATGDALNVSSAPALTVPGKIVDTSGTVVPVAGVAGVPSATGTVPPSWVLLRTRSTSPSTALTIGVDPDGATRTMTPSLTLTQGRALSRTVLGQPAATGRASAYTSTGQTRLSAQPYAWFAGALVLAANTHVLGRSTLRQVVGATDGAVTFAGHPSGATELAPGDLIVGEATPSTPEGLLRKVTSLDTSGADTVVHTTAAVLADVVRHGSFTTGSGSAPAEVAPGTTRARRTATVAGDLGSPCSVGGNLFAGSGSIGCDFPVDGPSWSGDVAAGIGASVTLDGSLDAGDAHISAGFRAAVSGSAQVSATSSTDVSVSKTVPAVEFPTYEFMVGPVPVVVQPAIESAFSLTGTVASGESANASFARQANVQCDTSSGCTAGTSSTQSADASFTGLDDSSLSASVGPQLSFKLYGVLGMSAGVGLGATVQTSRCLVTVDAGVGISFGVSLDVFSFLSVGKSYSIPLAETEVASIPVRNCAIWTGTLIFTSHLNWTSGSGPDTSDHDSNGSTSLSIDDVDGDPPPFGNYTLSGSGSGADVTRIRSNWCGAPDPASYQTQIDKYIWSGPVTDSGGAGPVPITIGWTGVGRRFVLDLMATNGRAKAAADHTFKYFSGSGADCQPEVLNESTEWSQDVFSVFSKGDTFATNELKFTVPSGSNTSQGTADIPASSDGAQPHYRLTWNLTKTCLKGGTACH